MSKRILVCDIDGTLLDGDRATVGLAALSLFLRRNRDDIRLVYATGRTFEATWRPIEKGVLPEPDAIASLVGTEIWFPDWRRVDKRYILHISQKWDHEQVRETLSRWKHIKPQSAEVQSPWKLSYYLRENPREVIARLDAALRQRGVEAKIVYSGGKYLDIIPARSGKAGAVKFISEVWAGHRDPVLACGDSGNDLDMLTSAKNLGVAVGNAEASLADKVEEFNNLYRSNHPYAAGVLEGGFAHRFWPR
jgi:sucrose-6F-phosphate phosphohydrolase